MKNPQENLNRRNEHLQDNHSEHTPQHEYMSQDSPIVNEHHTEESIHEHGAHGHEIEHEHMNHMEHDTHGEHSNHDHSSHHAGHAQIFKKKFFISLLFGIPILIFSPMMGYELPFTITFPHSETVVAILATILFLYGGLPFLEGAKDELKAKKPAMMTLISLGISVAYIYSMYAYVVNNIIHKEAMVMDFFWELASLILIMLLGHWIEMNAVNNAGSALESMAKLLPNSAFLLRTDGSSEEVPLTSVVIGDTILVQAGERVPTDGTILTGSSFVNESMVTGESKDIEKNIGDTLIGGSLNGSGILTVKVTGTGESGYLSQVMNLVSNAQNDKSRAESLSDKIAGLLFYFALVVGILSFIIWMAIGQSFDFSLERLVTVLIIACPHALGLAIPLVTARSTSISAQNGLLIQNRQSLETARKVDVVVMDKTGTLTKGNFAVSEFMSLKAEYSSDYILKLMGALEEGSTHPLAIGVLEELKKRNLSPLKAVDIENIPGAGMKGLYNDIEYALVSPSYLDANSIEYDRDGYLKLANKGNSVSYLIENRNAIGVIGQGDEIKEESRFTIKELLNRGIRPIMLTGDNEETAKLVGAELGIEEIHAEAKPEDKEKLVRELQSEGLIVMMVGDGVNDAPSLARADVGISIGAGTDVAIDAADVILVKSDPSDIINFLELAKNTTRKTIQNLWWGAGYNIIAIPLAAGILANWGVILSPAVGAVLMSLSTVIVALNAMTLKIKTKENN